MVHKSMKFGMPSKKERGSRDADKPNKNYEPNFQENFWQIEVRPSFGNRQL